MIRREFRALKAKGARFLTYPGFTHDADAIWSSPGGGARVAWFTDPDGNVLSLTQAGSVASPTGGPAAAHAWHWPRNSMTGRISANPASRPAARSVPVSRSSSMCSVLPQVSQITNMQSCRQPGWLFAR